MEINSVANSEFKEDAKFLIRKNMKGILEIVLSEISDFKQSTNMKLRSISVLFYLVKACGSLLSPNIEKILNTMYCYIDHEENISLKCEETAEILGLNIDQSLIIPTIVKHLTEMEVKNSYQPIYCRLKLLANVVSKIANIREENVEIILKLLSQLDIFNMPSDNTFSKQILYYCFKMYNSILTNLGKNCKNFHESFFFPLLLLQSLPETKGFHTEVHKSIFTLAELCGFNNVEQLYSLELSCVLEKFKETHKSWRRNSPDRFAFDTYVRNGGIALDKHWIDILMIISQCCEADKDIEMRIDMMILLDDIIDNSELADQIRNYVEFIIPEILIPAMAWKAQRTNNKVRKAALVCTIKIFKNGLIEADTACTFMKDLLLVLKSTLEDDWDAELRFLSIHLLKALLLLCGNLVTNENLLDIYPHILKRLDDSQDTNRILVCEAFAVYFKICQNIIISGSTFEYILNTAFIHLDDPNENVRKAVLNFLKEAKLANKEITMKLAESAMVNFTHKSILKELQD